MSIMYEDKLVLYMKWWRFKIDTRWTQNGTSSSSTFNVTRTQSVKDHTLFTALRQCWGGVGWFLSRCQNDIWLDVKTTSGSMVICFISIGRMPALCRMTNDQEIIPCFWGQYSPSGIYACYLQKHQQVLNVVIQNWITSDIDACSLITADIHAWSLITSDIDACSLITSDIDASSLITSD